MASPSSWQLRVDDSVERISKRRKFAKKHRSELRNVYTNLQRVLDALNGGMTLPTVTSFGFMHREGKGLWAIDQRGPNSPKKELRLYVYFEEAAGIIHVLRIGDKDSQQEDIRHCHRWIEQFEK